MKKGFTLIEIVGSLLVLSLILIIAVPQILNYVKTSKESTFESVAIKISKNILGQYDIGKLQKNPEVVLTNDFVSCPSDLVEWNEENGSCKYKLYEEDSKVIAYVVIEGKGNFDNMVAYGTYDNIIVEFDTTYNNILLKDVYDSLKGVNKPKLAQGMTPIKWDGSSWVTTTESDETWYDYTNKIWANAKTADGSMWVWIPRYVYKISSGWHSNIAGTIDVQFSMGTDDTRDNTVTLDTGTTSNASNNKWTNHPAFTFGSTELTGIWVAKFEATATEGVSNGYTSGSNCTTTLDNVTTKTIKVIPNVASWRCITPGNAFTVIRNMETKSIYGWDIASTLNANGTFTTDTNNVDTHLMKNIEWGAVAYLSKSSYGKNTTEVWINNDQNYTTGCAGNSTSEAGYNGCLNTYESTNGVQASTTGNIYGIYDMSGSAWEIVSTYVNNGNTSLNTYGSSIVNADSKYKDIYQVNTTDDAANNYATAINKKGDAIYETSNSATGIYSWFSDSSSISYSSSPFSVRGGFWSYRTYSGPFAFFPSNGYIYSSYGFRVTLLVGENL